MKIIDRGYVTCPCLNKLAELQEVEHQLGRLLTLRAEVECDCGKRYRLCESQFDGNYWRALTADE
jgi:hypothetical protein